MTREQAREAAAVMLAWADGKEVEYSPQGYSIWKPNAEPCWSWSGCNYRIKPTATLRPWTADEVPLGAQARNREHPKTRWLIDRTSSEENRKDWCEKYEHSTDGGKTWLPCGVVEEAK